jgi:hypothetical protein
VAPGTALLSNGSPRSSWATKPATKHSASPLAIVVALQLRVATAGLCSECGRIKAVETAVASETTCKATNLHVVDPWSVLLPVFDDAAHAGDNHV